MAVPGLPADLNSDPLPFQFWHRHKAICKNATFVDVDYPQLMERKRDRILANGLVRDMIFKQNVRPSSKQVLLRSDHYMAVACDLRDLKTLENILKAEMSSDSHILFVAEVSITYMPLVDSNELIRWAGTFDNAQFCLLEQFLPQGPAHPFAKTMLDHFNKLKTSIYAVNDYPSLDQQASRFSNAGWRTVNARNLWDLWSDEVFTPSNLRRNLDSIEPFDEWEEFALFAGHYFLIVASTTPTNTGEQTPPAELPRVKDHKSASIVLGYHTPPAEAALTLRRFAAAFRAGDQAVAFHGGQGSQRRLSSIDTLRRENSKPELQSLAMQPARIGHTITNINGTDALMVGGRRSPSQALADTWLIKTNGDLQQVQDLSPARFRHCAANVTVPYGDSEVEGVIVVGGKASDGTVLEDYKLWTSDDGWTDIDVVGPRPSARFGAAISSTGSGWGLMIGGMHSDGTVSDEIWEFHLSAASKQRQLQWVDRTRDVRSNTASASHGRFGASLVPFGQSLLVIGGICRKEILGFGEELQIITVGEVINVDPAYFQLPEDAMFLTVGCGVAAAGPEEIVVAGGGAVCFSMGSFWNQGYLTITRHDNPTPRDWSLSSIEHAATRPRHTSNPPTTTSADDKVKVKDKGRSINQSQDKGKSKSKGKQKGKRSNFERTDNEGKDSRHAVKLEKITIQTAEDFSEIVKASRPAIITGLDLGPCTSLWTLDYLKDKIGPDREVVIHETTSSHMTFQTKNFQYTKTPFGTFIDSLTTTPPSKTYLRSASSTSPTKLPTLLSTDFPTISPDFTLPSLLTPTIPPSRIHSTPLRISGPVSLWLHYDVLANILCQIVGPKTLTLYPPSAVPHLSFPPGASSSTLSTPPSPALTNPHIANLSPGDVLFIPPMWSHTATPGSSHSVAVNVFWRNLDKGYAAGRDVYGNRDLQAYETGRRDVERIVRAFRDVPADVKRFYLERLAGELVDAGRKGESVGKRD
ncbi:hypothetical protein BU24DRAFT_489902 [Aaosphaeria arxii CBS 175.79]|uniref:tRNA wybutosine-synthesizing protein 4 n=1 Tax=Aaosphaeria arxii CBS 175.79 TaxID=1450172 RepID=A0A6A5Y4D3_9PLEO|nr:uncharacterized protein BU24DRAFT_489902 [Aaosphaeria arxii CBS 175.79]KAF2020063.1 hypothetical protein BU24DRAFT_489902 [Aaosphaeria arxii CBS 175.79]